MLYDLFTIHYILIICILVRSSYQQYILIGNNLKYYSQTHKMPNTIQTFWHDANVDCRINLENLMAIYGQLMKISDSQLDQFGELMRYHIKKTLMHELHTTLTTTFFSKHIRLDLNIKLNNNLRELYTIDKKLAETILELSISKSYAFINHEDFIRKIVRLKLDEVQIVAVEKILDKYIPDKRKTKILPLLAYYITTVYKNRIPCISCNTYLTAVYERLPKELRFLYESLDQTIVLVNQAQKGSVAELDEDEKPFRLLFTANSDGLVAFGKQYGDNINYLGVKDNQTVFYWLGAGLKPNQLWYVIWPEYLYRWNPPGLMLFQNRETNKLLCLNINNMLQNIPDPKGIYQNKFIQLNAGDNMLNSQCLWRFKNFNKL